MVGLRVDHRDRAVAEVGDVELRAAGPQRATRRINADRDFSNLRVGHCVDDVDAIRAAARHVKFRAGSRSKERRVTRPFADIDRHRRCESIAWPLP